MQDNEEDDDGQDGQNRCRQDRAPVHAGVADEVLDGNLDRVLLLVRQNQQRQDVVVPAPHEAEDRQRDGDVGAQRQHDVGEDFPLAGTVDTRGLDQRQRQRHIVLAVHEDTGRSGDNRQDNAPDVVVQAHGADYAELGDGQRLAGNQGAQQEHAEHEVDVLDLKAVDSQRIAAHGTDEQCDEGADHSQEQAVLHIAYEAAVQNGLVMLRRRGGGEHMQRVGEQLAGRLKGAENQPDNGENHDDADCQRKDRHWNADVLVFHQVSPPLLTLNWAKAIRAKMIMTTVEIAEA